MIATHLYTSSTHSFTGIPAPITLTDPHLITNYLIARVTYYIASNSKMINGWPTSRGTFKPSICHNW